MGQKLKFLDQPLITERELQRLGDGRHQIARDFEGMQVFATIADGKVTRYEIKGGGNGRQALMFEREPAGGGIAPDVRTYWLCAQSGDTITCKQIQPV